MDVSPNPVRGEGSVRLSLVAAELGSLAIFDVRGRRVRTLAQRQLFESGIHELRWHGDDERGGSVPPGVYFLRFDGAAGMQIRKLLVAR
jgi:hypothetical protein